MTTNTEIKLDDLERLPSVSGSQKPTDDQLSLRRYSPEEEKKLMRRVDLRLIPLCGIMYCVSLIDRTNLANAALAGMSKELKLTKIGGVDRYSIISLVFFITYTLFQPPATIACRKIGPRVFLSSLVLLWGAVMLGMGFVKEWTSLVALRLVLGVFEAGFFPGVVYLLSTWYTRYEVGRRYAFFYLIGLVTAGFGGILAFGLMHMNGLAGCAGWRWIFIIEGLATIVISGFGFAFLRSFPDAKGSRSLKFMTEEERLFILARVNDDRGDATLEPFNLKTWASSGLDWKVWAYAVIFAATTTVSYALAYFLPQILSYSLGFDVGTAQCLVAPPYVVAGIAMVLCGWLGDKHRVRGPICAVNAVIAIIGLALVGFVSDPKVRYFGVFLATASSSANGPVAMAYQANNICGQWKRAFCSATLVGFGAIGGIIGSTVFRSQDAPGYVPGISVAMGAQVLVICTVGLLSWEFKRQNLKADRGETIIEGNPSFRYTI